MYIPKRERNDYITRKLSGEGQDEKFGKLWSIET